jgi:methionyl-tRNA formyltransferase
MIQRNLRIVFMGTPAFAVTSLQFLLEAGYPVVGVITAPDKMGGRGLKQVISSPVKQFAREHALPVLQPANLKSKGFLEKLRTLKADLQVVVAFRMLPEVVWNMPPKGTLNLHGSLLPSYRGAAPIQWAVIRGENVTGVTTFLLQQEIDTGKILQQRETPILPDDDAGSLHDRMMLIGAGLVVSTLDEISSGVLKGIPQDESRASHAPKIHHQDGRIQWEKPAGEIYNLIRGMSPFPGAWTILDGMELKVWKSRIHSTSAMTVPGTLSLKDKLLLVQTGDNELELLEVQMTGKRRMNARDFINGYRIKDWSLT